MGQVAPMGGSVIVDAAVISVAVFVTLTATLHLWGRVLVWLIRHAAKNVAALETLLVGKTSSRVLGQGQTRPPGR